MRRERAEGHDPPRSPFTREPLVGEPEAQPKLKARAVALFKMRMRRDVLKLARSSEDDLAQWFCDAVARFGLQLNRAVKMWGTGPRNAEHLCGRPAVSCKGTGHCAAVRRQCMHRACGCRPWMRLWAGVYVFFCGILACACPRGRGQGDGASGVSHKRVLAHADGPPEACGGGA